MAEKKNIIRPFEGFQEKFVRSNLDLVIGGGCVAAGKSAGAVLCIAEPSLDPKFRAVFLRNNLGDLKSGGGILDEFKKMYGSYVNVVESGDPHVDFPSGARIDVTHIADQSKSKVPTNRGARSYSDSKVGSTILSILTRARDSLGIASALSIPETVVWPNGRERCA